MNKAASENKRTPMSFSNDGDDNAAGNPPAGRDTGTVPYGHHPGLLDDYDSPNPSAGEDKGTEVKRG